MRIADFDDSTRRLVFAAHVMTKFPSSKRLRYLKRAVDQFDAAHEAERTGNLMRALFGPEGICTEAPR